MELTQPCLACNSVLGCDCKRSMVRVFELFMQVDERCRISTQADTSDSPSFTVKNAGIDKLDFQVINPSESLIQLIRQYPITRTKTGLWVHCLQNGILVKARNLKQPAFVTNPNKFNNFEDYFSAIKSFITIKAVPKTHIVRLDLNLDFDAPFQNMIQFLNVRDKRIQFEFVQNGTQTNAIRLGKNDEKIQIYDKGYQKNVDEPWTRIETQLKGKKIPFKNLKEIETSFFETISNSRVFENIEFVLATFTQAHLLPESIREKVVIAQGYLKNDGYLKMRKSMNKNGNFKRDFNKILNVERLDHQPKQLYLRGIKNFLKLSDQ